MLIKIMDDIKMNNESSMDGSSKGQTIADGDQQCGDLLDSPSTSISTSSVNTTQSQPTKKCSWIRTTSILFSQYICLAIMSFPHSYSVLGLVPGLILTIVTALTVAYTSYTVWRMCIRYPSCKNIIDIASILFGNKWGKYFTIVLFLLNNTFVQAFHCLAGAQYLSTIIPHRICKVFLALVISVISFSFSLPRNFSTLSRLATVSAITAFTSVLLATIFSTIESPPSHPSNISIWTPPPTTTFVTGVNAFLNIGYTFIGQITLPSFISEMSTPLDFPKVLTCVTIAEVIVYSLVGALIYISKASSSTTISSPAFSTLTSVLYKNISFSFMVPTIIFVGVLYATVTARFLLQNILHSKIKKKRTEMIYWIIIMLILWSCAFVIAEIIPFFANLLSLMCSLFDGFFGFIFWGWAYILLQKDKYGKEFWKRKDLKSVMGLGVNLLLILIGVMFLTVGSYTTLSNIVQGYRFSTFGGAFSCV